MEKKRFIKWSFASLFIFLIILSAITFYYWYPKHNQSIAEKRDHKLLLAQYHALRKEHPKAAKEALQILLKQSPNEPDLQREMGYFLLENKQNQEALTYFLNSEKITADPQTQLQIAYIYLALGNKLQATNYFEKIVTANKKPYSEKALAELRKLSGPKIIESKASLKSDINHYYQLQKTDSAAAQNFLNKIAQENPQNAQILAMMGYAQLEKKHNDKALEYFERSNKINPDPRISAQIGYLLAEKKQYPEAVNYFKTVSVSSDPDLRKQATTAIAAIQKIMATKKGPRKIQHQYAIKKSIKSYPTGNYLLDQFYAVKGKDPQTAKQILLSLLQKDPDNIVALKELAYLYYAEKNYPEAYCYFLKVFNLTHDYKIAAQLGYLLDAINHKHDAYHFFTIAAKSPDPILSQKSNQALTNLAGWNTRLLPDPFFADIYLAPLYYGRFSMGILETKIRAGVYLDKAHRAELYTFFRYMRDNRSNGSGALPQIYEDNASITGIGLRYQLLEKIPLYAYAEYGKAYDLINRKRDRWQVDRRAGLIYFDSWGRPAYYQPSLVFPFKQAGDFYGDLSYYSRYNNIIATGRVRQGLRILEYRSSSLDFYLKGQLSEDKRREFFNNYFEWGPGIVLVPNNRYNATLRFEMLHGYYLPAGSPDPNPYGSRYHTNNAQFELYARF